MFGLSGKLATGLDPKWDLLTGYDCISADSSRREISDFLNENWDRKQVLYSTERGYYKIFYEEKENDMSDVLF